VSFKQGPLIHLSKYYPPEWGGIERVVYEMVVGASKDPHFTSHSQIVLAFTEKKEFKIEELENQVTVIRCPVLKMLASQPVSPSYLKNLKKLIKEHPNAILLFHLPNPLATAALFFLTRKFQGRVIVVYHADISKQKRLGAFYRPLLKRFLSRASEIWVSSPILSEKSLVLEPFLKKVKLLPFGIHSEFNEKTLLPGGSLKLLFVGRLVSYKGVPVLLRALKEVHPTITLTVAGEGPEEEALRTLTKELDLESRVEWKGRVSEEEKKQLLMESHLACLPSLTEAEAYGMIQIEAFQASRPVLSSHLKTGVSWINQDKKTGRLFEVGNHLELAALINELNENRALLLQYSNAAYVRGQELSSEKMTETMADYLGL